MGGRALLLLGKEEAAHVLALATPRITWVLRDANGIEQDYRHFPRSVGPFQRDVVLAGSSSDG
ncbi:MAG: hypothetical protein R6U98_12310 [Pirellulaceae bacterium]